MIRRIAGWLDRIINWAFPLPKELSDEWLAQAEAHIEVWGPDEVLAAHQKLTDPAAPPAGVSVTPAAADETSAGNSGGGGHSHHELIEELVEEYRQKLYGWFRP